VNRLISLFLLLVATATVHAQNWQQRPNAAPQACAVHMPYGIPQVQKPDVTPICRQGYFLLHDNQAKHAVWGAWLVTPQTVNGCHPRSNNFLADASLPPNKRATPDDYTSTGYDRGHLANDAHQSWNRDTGNESFLMSNMMPQLPGLNRGIWKLLETATGAWVYDSQAAHLIYAGPVYNVATDRKIGKNQVNVPNGFFKIIVNTKTGATLAFLFPHKEGLGNDLGAVQSTVADIERITGVVFPVPGNKTVKQPGWPINFKNVMDAKRQLCKG
jgi:endonuclease G